MIKDVDKTKLKLDILHKFNSLRGEKHNQGINDCNMLFMELHEPELAKKMKGKYNSIKEGCRLAKKLTGYSSVRTFLKKSDKYVEIQKFSDIVGDVIIFPKSHDVYISLGKNWFGYIGDDQILSVAFKRNYDNYKIYRKVK